MSEPKWFSRLLREIQNAPNKSDTGASWLNYAQKLARDSKTNQGEINYFGLQGMLTPPNFDSKKIFTKSDFEPLQDLIPRTKTFVLDQPQLSYYEQDERDRLMSMIKRGDRLSNSQMDFVHRMNEQASRSPLWGNVDDGLMSRYSTLRTTGGNNYREYLMYHPDAVPDDIHFDANHYGNVGTYNPQNMTRGIEGLRQIGWTRLQDVENPLRRSALDSTAPVTNIEEAQANRHTLGGQLGYDIHPVSRRDYAPDSFPRAIPVGDAPFKKEWPALMFRRALWDAATSGNSGLGWTGPLTQSARWQGNIGKKALDTYGKDFPKLAKTDLARLGGNPNDVHNFSAGLNRTMSDEEIDDYARDNVTPEWDDADQQWYTPDFDTTKLSIPTDMGLMSLDNRINDKIQEEGLPLFKDGGTVPGYDKGGPVKWFSRTLNELRNAPMQADVGQGWLGLLGSLQRKGLIKASEADYLGLPGMLGGPNADRRFTKDDFESLQDLVSRTQSNTFDDPYKWLWAHEPSLNTSDGQNHREHLLWHPDAVPTPMRIDDQHYGDVPNGQNQISWLRMQDNENPFDKSNPLSLIDELQSLRHAKGSKFGYSLNPVGKEMGDAPFKKDWEPLTFRRALWDASTRDSSGLGWTASDMQAIRSGGNKEPPIIRLYDKTLPKIASGELSRLGSNAKVLHDPKALEYAQDYETLAERLTDRFTDAEGNFDEEGWSRALDDPDEYSGRAGVHVMPLDNRIKDKIQDEGLPLFKDGGEVDLSPERFYRDRIANASGQHAFAGGGTAKNLRNVALGLLGGAGVGASMEGLSESDYPVLQRIFGNDDEDLRSIRSRIRATQSKYLPEELDSNSSMMFAPGGEGSILGSVAEWAMRHPVETLEMADPTGLVGSGLDLIDRHNHTGDYKGKESEDSALDYPGIVLNNAAWGLPSLVLEGINKATEGDFEEPEQVAEKPKLEFNLPAYGKGGTVGKPLKSILEELESLLAHQRGRGVGITPEMEATAREGVGSGLGAAYSLADAKGLDMSTEARMQRMAEQGYDNPAYHGTHYEPRLAPRGDFNQFADWKESDPYDRMHSTILGTHLAEDPTMANSMADASKMAFKDKNALAADQLEEVFNTSAYQNYYSGREKQELADRIAHLRATPARFEPQGGYVLPLQFRGDVHDLNNDPIDRSHPDSGDDQAVKRDIFDFAMKGRGNHPGLGLDWFKDQIMKARRNQPYNWKGGQYVGPTDFFRKQGTSDLGYFGTDTVAGREVVDAYRNYLREQGTPNLGYSNTEEVEVDGGNPLSYIIPSPDDMRSPFAAFDPDNQGSGHILGGIGGLGMLGALSGGQRDED